MFLMKCLKKKNHWCWEALEHEGWREVGGGEPEERKRKSTPGHGLGGITGLNSNGKNTIKI